MGGPEADRFGPNPLPFQRKSNKIFERLYSQGRRETPAPLEIRKENSKDARVNTAKNRKKRMGTISTTYSQTLQRNMFARQREQTDKTYKKVLREERLRIIKSASRRNPKLLAQAIVRSKQALQEHAEWRINQEIMRSCSNS